jgi:hypothetical protein
MAGKSRFVNALARSRRMAGRLTRLGTPKRERKPVVAQQDAEVQDAGIGLSTQRAPSTDGVPDTDDATRRLLIDFVDTASMHGEVEEQEYFETAAKLGVDHLTAARARARAIELVATGRVEDQDLYQVALRLLAERR